MTGGAWELVAGYSKFDASDITSSTAGMQLDSATANTNEADTYRLGLKFIPDPNTRIMLSYVNTDFDGDIVHLDYKFPEGCGSTYWCEEEQGINAMVYNFYSDRAYQVRKKAKDECKNKLHFRQSY